MNQTKPEPLIFRQVAFPLSAFDYLKEYQRAYERQHGIRLNNNQLLAIILSEHQQTNGARGVRNVSTGNEAAS